MLSKFMARLFSGRPEVLSRCMKNSLINVNTVHMKHNMDDRSNKHGGQKINEEETLTKIITNQHDLTLSHSQSQELELILSDETLLSSITYSMYIFTFIINTVDFSFRFLR
jgi:hypothetical protein